jgi:MFS family permease
MPRVFYGWYVLAASFVILFLNAGGRMVIGVMVKPMTDEFGWSRSAVTSAIFLNLAVYALSVIVTGRLYDRYGPKWVVIGSTVLFSAGYALMATMHSLWEFLLYFGVINAAGLGGTTVAVFGSLIANWFEKRRGLAITLAFAGNCFGQFFLVPAFSDMIVGSGWRTTSLWIGIICFVANIGLTFGVIRGNPDMFGLLPYGTSARVEGGRPGPATASSAPELSLDVDLTLSQAIRTPSLWLFTVAMFVCGAADFLVTTHLVPMVTDYGLSTATAASMLAWLGLLGLAGILLAGPASDAIGNKLPIAMTFGLRVVLFIMVLFIKGPVSFWVFSLGFGITLLVTAPLNATLIGVLYGVKNIGFISGFINTVHMLGGGLWSYLGGVIFDRTGDYDATFIFAAAMSAVALVCTLFIRERRHLPPRTQA